MGLWSTIFDLEVGEFLPWADQKETQPYANRVYLSKSITDAFCLATIIPHCQRPSQHHRNQAISDPHCCQATDPTLVC